MPLWTSAKIALTLKHLLAVASVSLLLVIVGAALPYWDRGAFA
jgi:hypothetical protein